MSETYKFLKNVKYTLTLISTETRVNKPNTNKQIILNIVTLGVNLQINLVKFWEIENEKKNRCFYIWCKVLRWKLICPAASLDISGLRINSK